MAVIEIGSTPNEEDCAQCGVTENYQSLARLECQAYIAALRTVYGTEPAGAELRLKGNRHDFGTYYEVVCRFDADTAEARDYAFKIEDGLATWSQAGMWAPVTYHRSQAIHTISDPAMWTQATNPGAQATPPAAG